MIVDMHQILNAPRPLDRARGAVRALGLSNYANDVCPPNREDIAAVGLIQLPHTYADTDDDLKALRRYVEHLESADGADRHQANRERLALEIPGMLRQIMFSPKWASCGFPVVQIGEIFAAALMATEITPGVVDDLRGPWAALWVDFPNRLLSVNDESGHPYPIVALRIAFFDVGHGRLVDWQAMAANGITIGRSVPAAQLLTPVGQDTHEYDDVFGPPIAGNEVPRLYVLFERLVVGLCLSMSDPDNVRERPLVPGKLRKPTKRKNPRPTFRFFTVGIPTSVDCRAAVRAYAAGVEPKPGKALALQMLVRGHWKRQHHGERNAKVKIIWVQPYWRGPDTAPILTRPHVMPTDHRSPNAEVSYA